MLQIRPTKMFSNRTTFFIREHVGMLKLKSHYDIIDPNTKENLGEAIEYPGALMQFLRLLLNKRNLPTSLIVTDFVSNQTTFRLEKSWGIFNFQVDIYDNQDQLLGSIKNKVFSLGGELSINDANEAPIGKLKGKFASWDYKLHNALDEQVGQVTKKWAGVGKELFTSADNYVIEIDPVAAKNNKEEYSVILMASAFAFDLLFTERS